MKIAVLKREVEVGTRVTLHQVGGRAATGCVIEMGESHVRLDVGDRTVTVFDENLAGWEVLKGRGLQQTKESHAEPSVAGRLECESGTEAGQLAPQGAAGIEEAATKLAPEIEVQPAAPSPDAGERTSSGSAAPSSEAEGAARTVGRITWFNSGRGFGFIETRAGKEVWFHISEVHDESLRQKLEGPVGQVGTDVSFEVRAAFGQKYDRATDVRQAFRERLVPQPGITEARKPDQRPQSPSPPLPFGAKSTGRTISGRITSFGNQGFGFLETPDGRTLFFRLEDVRDDMLRQQLLTPNQAPGLEVSFEQQASPGHKYDRAVEVGLQLGDEDMLIRASQLERSKDFSTALTLVRRVLAKTPDNGEALALQQRLLKSIARVTVLPRGSGPFTDAKRAWVVDQDLEQAEKLYRLAIERNDRLEPAVKDLASLLQQRDRAEEAIALLEQYRHRATAKEPFDQMLATTYEHAGQFSKAIEILTGMERAAIPAKRLVLLRRIAHAHFKLQQYGKAESALQEALRLRPGDPLASRWLATLQRAREVGSFGESDELLSGLGDVTDLSSGLTPLAEAMLDKCRFDGVEPSKVSSGQFTLDDVTRLEALADELGTQRPRDRAAYYLSAAAILRKIQPGEETGQFTDFLERYFLSRGDAARLEQEHLDAVRTYYTESLALSRGQIRGDARRGGTRPESPQGYALRMFLRSYLSPQTERQLAPGGQLIGAAISAVSQDYLENGTSPIPFFNGLLNLSVRTRTALPLLQRATMREDVSMALAEFLGCANPNDKAEVKGALEKKRMALADALRRLDTGCVALTQLRLTTASMEDLSAQLEKLNREFLSDLDCQRLNSLRQVAADSLAFCQATDFEERERHYFSVRTAADRLRKEIGESPTHVSFESFLRVVEHLSSLVEESYAELARTSVPDLRLILEVETYIPDSYSDVDLQIGVANRVGCSPASSLELHIGPSKSPYFATRAGSVPAVGALRGGATTVVRVPLRVSDQARQEGAFPIVLCARFQNRLGQRLTSAETQLTVRLYDESKFALIEPNPYAPWSEGGAVDADMFFGREELLRHVSDALLTGGGTKSVIIYGQKRAGKSSVLEHLRRRLLAANAIPVAFSLQDVSTSITEADFLYRILQGIQETVRAESFQSQWSISFQPPPIQEFRASPALLFHAQMSQFVHDCRLRSKSGAVRLVLLVDEFTDIFTKIQERVISRDFMKLWKAIIEKRYFSSVLVGKDIMRAFMAQFENELGVIEAQRLTYLPESAARDLITKPIARDCYRGNAIARILELTACSPYYTMMFCDRFVDYMNSTRSLYVTEADVERVKAAMISGPDCLTERRFAPLYDPGEGAVDTGMDPAETFALCSLLARNSVNRWCLRSALSNLGGKRDQILDDLESREVLERKRDNYRIRVGLFHEWLLVNGPTA